MSNIVKLGKHSFYLNEKLLYLDKNIVPIENKFLDVLAYLIENENKYVSIQELHENVWTGKIVSDATVRRVISKLRAVLEDDSSKPTIITSIPKRGYRINIKFVNQIKSYSNEHILEKLSSNTPYAISTKSSVKFIFLALIMAFTIIIFFLFPFDITHKTERNNITLEHRLPVNSKLISLSKDSELIFYQVPNGKLYYNSYIKNTSNKTAVKIGDNHPYINYAEFINDNNAIVLAFNSANKKGSLVVWDLSSNLTVVNKRTLISNIYGVTSIATNNNKNEAALAIVDNDIPNKSIFKLVRWGKEYLNSDLQLTFTASDSSFDSHGKFSNDSKYFSFIRTPNSNHRDLKEFLIINVKSKKIIYKNSTLSDFKDYVWLDNNKIVLLDGDNLIKLDVNGGVANILNDSVDKSVKNIFNANDKILLYKRAKLSSRYVELELDKVGKPIERIIDRPIASLSIDYSRFKKNYFFEVYKNDDFFSLVLSNLESDKVVLLESLSKIELLDESAAGEILLLLGNELVVYDLNSFQYVNITYEQENIGDAIFSFDSKQVYFTKEINDRWAIYSFEIEVGKRNILLNGFNGIKRKNGDYLLSKNTTEVYSFEDITLKPIRLDVNIPTNFDIEWVYDDGLIYYIDIGSKMLQGIDIQTSKLNIFKIESKIVGSGFSYNKSNKSWIFDGYPDFESTIWSIDSKP